MKKEISAGLVRGGKISVKNKKTGRVSWRTMTSGVKLDFDGNPTHADFDKEGYTAPPKQKMHNPRDS